MITLQQFKIMKKIITLILLVVAYIPLMLIIVEHIEDFGLSFETSIFLFIFSIIYSLPVYTIYFLASEHKSKTK